MAQIDYSLFPDESKGKQGQNVGFNAVDDSLFPALAKQNPIGKQADPEPSATVPPVIPQSNYRKLGFDDVVMTPTQTIDTAKMLGRITAGGALKMIENVAALPFEAVGTFSKGKGYSTAKMLRDFIPDIKPETTGEEIAQKLVQYGVPAATSIKLADRVLKGAPWAARVVGDIFSGAVSDFVVADPSEVTLGDIAGYGPTKSKAGESPLSKRAKVAAEGAATAAVLIPPLAAGGAVAKWVTTRVLPTDKMIMDALAATFHKMSLNPEKAIKNIQDGLKKYEASGFAPTTGTLSNDEGLIAFEKAASAQQKYAQSAARMMQRKRLNLNHVSEQLEQVTKQMGGDPEDAVEFFYRYFDNAVSGKKNVFEETVKQLEAEKLETKNLIYDVAKQADAQPELSTLLDTALVDELNRFTTIKNNLYGAIDPDHVVEVPKARLKDAYNKMMRVEGPLDRTASKIPSDVTNSIKKLLFKKIKKGKTEIEMKLMFGDLVDYQNDLSEAIATARANNQGAVVERLTEFKKAVRNEAKYLEIEGAPEVAERARKANSFYEKEYVPRFKKYVGDNFRKAIRKGSPFTESDTARKFLQVKNGSQEASEQLDLILRGSPNTQANVKAAEDYIVSTFAQTLYGVESPKVAIQRIDKFLNNKGTRETLKQFPEAKRKILEYRNSFLNRYKSETALGNRIESAKQFMSFSEREINLNAAKWFVDKDPVAAMRRAIDSPNPEKAMKQLVDMAAQDGSGNAKKGLRAALDRMIESPRGRGGVRLDQELSNGKNFEISSARLRNLLEYEPTKNAISQLYSPEEMATLKNLHGKIRLMDRINLQVPKGSPTAILEESVRSGQVLAFSLFGIVKGRGVFMVSRKIQQMLGRDPVEKAWALLSDAMLDPELAKTLLMQANEKNLPKIKARLSAHMLNNMTLTSEESK
jgi:hypothetical protein